MTIGGQQQLTDVGSVSLALVIEKAHSKYRKYRQKALAPVACLQSLRVFDQAMGRKPDCRL
jgi:hypothetical protein